MSSDDGGSDLDDDGVLSCDDEELEAEPDDLKLCMEPALYFPKECTPETDYIEVEFREFTGDPADNEAVLAYHTEHVIHRRSEGRERCNHKMKQTKIASLAAAELGSRTWQPQAAACPVFIDKEILDTRWMCERKIRATVAYLGVHKGLKIRMTNEKVTAKCNNKGCTWTMVFDLQPSSLKWKQNKVTEHLDACLGVPVPADVGATTTSQLKVLPCKSAYTPAKVARLVLSDALSDPTITAKTIGDLVKKAKIYTRLPSPRFFVKVKDRVLASMTVQRAVNMAALEGYAQLCRELNHQVSSRLAFG